MIHQRVRNLPSFARFDLGMICRRTSELSALRAVLLNTSGTVPLHDRFRALFTLKSFAVPSALLKHELAYCLGQMKLVSALPVLQSVLENIDEDPMVRHEAEEAMGAISSPDFKAVLTKYLTDPNRNNSEEGRQHLASKESSDQTPTYTSIDPAPPSSKLLSGQNQMTSTLLDTSVPLFQRYRAMFALRNTGTPAAVDALAAGFSGDSALCKHEIAFVFGQLLSAHSVPSLLNVLQDGSESDMVRHEAAEALGGIATPEVLPHLKEWMTREDSPRVVRESCQVAIDMWEYENSGQFQYANGLESVRVEATPA
ncbi:ARM repeat-containing protein [Suillus clintonianus]|uniref:ARM repeat-containing protein n=1 Tax=Suillus clintonianus TaxID=1904413 RepID=UPI001B884BE3|nr:ARM repeat-containing protein [Suillus clintonianus]KAG2125696.1 ARM repeat-containing protein [Suillus clintonianus]